jgi:hypothetical protein
LSVSAVVLGVLAEARGGLRRPYQLRPGAVRRGGLGEAVARIGDERTALDEVVEGFDIGAVGNRSVGDPKRRGKIADLIDGLALDPGVQLVGLLIGLFGDRQWRLLVDPLLMPGHRTQVEPLLCGAAADVDQTVFGPGDAGHRESTRVTPWPAEHLEVAHRVVGQAEDLSFQHRQVDQFCGAAHPGGDRRRARVCPGKVLAYLAADENRCAVGGSAAEPHNSAGPCLQREFGGGPVAPWPVEAERRDRRDR